MWESAGSLSLFCPFLGRNRPAPPRPALPPPTTWSSQQISPLLTFILPLQDGRTPLIAAAERKSCDIVIALLNAGAPVAAAAADGRTALICAAACGCAETTKALLERGAPTAAVSQQALPLSRQFRTFSSPSPSPSSSVYPPTHPTWNGFASNARLSIRGEVGWNNFTDGTPLRATLPTSLMARHSEPLRLQESGNGRVGWKVFAPNAPRCLLLKSLFLLPTLRIWFICFQNAEQRRERERGREGGREGTLSKHAPALTWAMIEFCNFPVVIADKTSSQTCSGQRTSRSTPGARVGGLVLGPDQICVLWESSPGMSCSQI